jgi:hypothetical protein
MVGASGELSESRDFGDYEPKQNTSAGRVPLWLTGLSQAPADHKQGLKILWQGRQFF